MQVIQNNDKTWWSLCWQHVKVYFYVQNKGIYDNQSQMRKLELLVKRKKVFEITCLLIKIIVTKINFIAFT